VYVQPFPGPGSRVQVSNAGGSHPQWGRNNGELFFLEGDSMMAVDISPTGDFTAGAPRRLFQAEFACFAGNTCYGVAPDGRFLMIQPIEPERPPTQIDVVLNWHEELKRLVPTRWHQLAKGHEQHCFIGRRSGRPDIVVRPWHEELKERLAAPSRW
jgi:hypothetical protein